MLRHHKQRERAGGRLLRSSFGASPWDRIFGAFSLRSTFWSFALRSAFAVWAHLIESPLKLILRSFFWMSVRRSSLRAQTGIWRADHCCPMWVIADCLGEEGQRVSSKADCVESGGQSVSWLFGQISIRYFRICSCCTIDGSVYDWKMSKSSFTRWWWSHQIH